MVLNRGSTSRELNYNFARSFEISRDLINNSTDISIRHFSPLESQLTGYIIPTTRYIQVSDLFHSTSLASQLVQDTHSNGNKLLSVAGLPIALLP